MSKEIRVATVEVEKCVECPHRSFSSFGAPASFYYCIYPHTARDEWCKVKTDRKIVNFFNVPNWCPLPIKEHENPDEPDPKLVSYFPTGNPKEIRIFKKAAGLE